MTVLLYEIIVAGRDNVTERRYLLAEAAADLRDAGLLSSTLVHSRGEWLTRDQKGSQLDGAFLGASLDSRSVTDGSLFLGLAGEHVDGRNYVGAALRSGASAALTSEWSGAGPDPLMSGDPGHDAVVLIATDPLQALAILADCWRTRLSTKAVAVTGSNGKTTTKDFLHCLLSHHGSTHATAGNYNNDIGLPLTLLGLRECHQWAVLELGASEAGDIDRLAALAKPQVGVITNAAGAHLEGFGSLAGVIATKGELLDHLPSDGAAVLDRDGVGFDSWSERAPCQVLDWGHHGQRGVWSWQPTDQGDGGIVTLDQETWTLPLPGRHNGANLVAAVLAARALTGETLDIAAALTQFSGSSHRNRLLDAAGITLFDDTYNANPASVLAAAQALMDLPGQGRRFAVLGAMAELGTDSLELHHETGAALCELGLDGLWSVGKPALELAAGFTAAGGDAEALQNVDSALHAVLAAVEPGDIILVKGSRSAGMENFVRRFLQHRNPDMKNLETS
jgi:UDP-N-acetylmuramoyl-tripeptide--D-alanyl-D-alanine ligase